MPDHIRIYRATGTWVVRAGGAVLAETRNALELHEGSALPVIYFPRGDVAMAFMDRSDSRSRCPFKGEAVYFDIVTPGARLKDAAWSYENPGDGLTSITGLVAFHPDRVTLERI
ncbi:MAG: DUF427 domain-containing protein [Gemmobacter sp.]|nr:DUF427 domain-containing protein [Gemmobacter sp.]